MCGICGVWEYGSANARIDIALVERMRDTMPHRGPDDTGAEILDDGRLGLGFRRLAIVDLSPAGNQPMRGCAAQSVWIVFNGEIYNHGELRKGLEQRGHKYASRTDTETILHLYEELGLDFVNEVDGDFAIALWDATREQLVLVRDRVGVKPLYFHQQAGRLIFASEIKAILAHPSRDSPNGRGRALPLSLFSDHARATNSLQRHSQTSRWSYAGHRSTRKRATHPILGRAAPGN